MGRGIKLSEIAERMDLKNLTPELDLTEKEVHVPDASETPDSVHGILPGDRAGRRVFKKGGGK